MIPQAPDDPPQFVPHPGERETWYTEQVSPAAPVTREEAREAINELFRRAMQHGDSRQWMKGLLTFIAGMRRYSVFNGKLIYIQRPGAVAVGTARYWAKRGRSVRPGAMPIVIFVPKGPFTLVYEYEDTEGTEPRRPHGSFAATGYISDRDWTRLKAAVERDGRKAGEEHGLFRIVEEGLGHARAGDVHFQRDAQGRFVIRINRNLAPPAKWTTLVHELGHVYCGHCGGHPRGWWPDRRRLGELDTTMQDDIREFEAEAVAWIVASRAGIETRSADYLATRAARLDNECVDIDSVLHGANHVESIAPTTDLKTFRADDQL
jgi:hypothetical protein